VSWHGLWAATAPLECVQLQTLRIWGADLLMFPTAVGHQAGLKSLGWLLLVGRTNIFTGCRVGLMGVDANGFPLGWQRGWHPVCVCSLSASTDLRRVQCLRSLGSGPFNTSAPLGFCVSASLS
jgi:hypothetical protein